MNRNRNSATPVRLKVLPGCLVMALSMGAAFSGPACANTDDSALSSAEFDIDAMLASLAQTLSEAIVDDARIPRLQSLPRSVDLSPPVTNCNDDGQGSLREAVTFGHDGDTIDLTGLTCSKITLTTGELESFNNNLTILGPGASNLEISGSDASRVLNHFGNGTLELKDLTISHGHKYLLDGDTGFPGGACVFSNGTLGMSHMRIKSCYTGSADVRRPVRGGAIYAQLGAVMGDSSITNSTAHSIAFEARGGGVYTAGPLFMANSTVSGNHVSGTVATGGGAQAGSHRPFGAAGASAGFKYTTLSDNSATTFGGGAYTVGNTTISNSTVSGNHASRGGGLYVVNSSDPTATAKISASTISGNGATDTTGAGGIQIAGFDASILDSTIAFNTSFSSNLYDWGAGVRINTSNQVTLQNTIIAGNTTNRGNGPHHDDIGGPSGASLRGGNDLIYFASSLGVPFGTIVLADPMLRPLADNGGTTRTHMPNFGSPVIDVGNNLSGAISDQRASGFPRIRGPQADIGAVEFNLVDRIFKNGFDPPQ